MQETRLAQKIKPLKIGDLTAPIPIIQGGMGVGVSSSGLASAVANEGGIGVMSTAGLGLFEPDGYRDYPGANARVLVREIKKARTLTKGIIGVNILVAMTNFGDLASTAMEAGADIIFSGAGLPLKLPGYLKPGCKTKLVPIVSSARAIRIIAKKWKSSYNYVPDAVVVEGPLAGGHLGFSVEQINDPAYQLEKIVPEVLQAVKSIEQDCQKQIPVICGGGIYTGADILKFIKLGAAGVQMGTRFVTTFECDASDEFKQMYLDAKLEDIVIIKSPVGMPGRAITNKFLQAVSRGEKIPFQCPYHCIITCDYKNSPYCIALALLNAKLGKMDLGFAFAGQNAYRATKIISVKELISTLMQEYYAAQAASSSAV